MFPLHSLQFNYMETLYEDEYVLLKANKIVIKNYRFPNKKCRVITIDQISILWFELQETCNVKVVRTWGKSANTYWALDVKRCIPGINHWNIVIDVGQSLRIGFSVEDGTAFMEAMRDILDYHVIVVDRINI